MNLYKNHVGGGRWLSPALWDTFPAVRSTVDPGAGWFRVYDWIDETLYDASTLEFTGWQLTANSGSAVLTAGNYGRLLMSATSTNGQGPQMQLGDVAWIDLDTTTDPIKRVCMEVRGTWSGISTVGPEFFFGLANEDGSIIASGANSATDYIGIQRVAADVATALGGVALKASGSVSDTATYTSSAATMANGTVKYGLEIIPGYGTRTYFNGTQEADVMSAASISGVAMLPSIVVQGNGTDTPVFSVDWIAVGIE